MRRLLTIALLALALTRPCAADESPAPAVVVTTSVLEQATRDLLGPQSPVTVTSLQPPASCPGHFDLSPRLLPALRQARLLLRHDFQAGLDTRLEGIAGPELHIAALPSSGSLLVPAHYEALLQAAADQLAQAWPDQADTVRARLQALRPDLQALDRQLRQEALPLAGAPVIAAFHQQDFCRYLGLDVVAVLPPGEDHSPRRLQPLLEARAEAVVGNLQNGRQAAEALAERRDQPVAILSNFPGVPGYGDDLAALCRANLEQLRAALRTQSCGQP